MLAPSKIFHWECVSQTPEKASFRMVLGEGNPYFEGHFPGNPVLPGVGIVDATLVALSQISDSKNALVTSAKFLGILKPGDLIQLELSPSGDNAWDAIWNLVTSDQIEKRAELKIRVS